MASFDYDVIVIGSGAGGTVCARLLAKSGKSVGIVEASKMGGECPSYACIPTKALLESAHLYYHARNSDKLGLRGSTIGFNYPNVKAWKNKAVKNTGVDETESSLEKAGITVIHGSAHFIDPHTITVGRARFKAKQFVIATGAETKVPSITGLTREDFLTYKDALELSRPPKSIVIIGGGAVGVEFASIFGSFGSKVYLVEKSAHLLTQEDPLAGKTVLANLQSQYDVTGIVNATVQSIARRGSKKQLVLRVGGKLHTIVVDQLMMATGKQPALDLGLENAGVKYSTQGVAVKSNLQTSAKHIFAVGDCLGGYQFTHVSLYQGRLAAHNLLHNKKQLHTDYGAIPRTIFSSPEVSAVGLSSTGLKNHKIPTTSATTDIKTVGRANTSPTASGFVKITAHKKSGVILSACIVAPQASEMIHELTLAVANNLTASDLANTIHAFPTWSEAIRVTASKLATT